MLKTVVDDADRGNQPEVLDVRASRFRHPQPVEKDGVRVLVFLGSLLGHTSPRCPRPNCRVRGCACGVNPPCGP